ncbi:MAG: hypothetical protein RL272_718 [Candidatus Parcubacteria bacterium]|jgi:MFS family permease
MKRFSATAISVIVFAPAAALAASADVERARSAGYAAGFFGVMATFMLLIAAVFVGLLVLWILMLVDCFRREWPEKTAWTAILILSIFMGLHWLSAILYYFLVKRKNPGTMPPAAPQGPPSAG